MCVFVWAWQVRDTGALQSKSWHWGVPTARWTWLQGGALLGESLLCHVNMNDAVSSTLIAICRRITNNHEVLVFKPVFLLRTPRRHKPSSKSHSILCMYRKHNRTAFNRPCTAAEFVHYYVRVDQSATTQACWHERASQVYHCTSILCFFFPLWMLFLLYVKLTRSNFDIFPSTADTQPCVGPRSKLYYF